MIVHRIELSNIKSYDSLAVELNPGVNFIAGRNGAGKTTLIEAVGFAIYGYAPDKSFNEYFLRDGEKQGEIRVTFSNGPERFTVVRKVGKADTARVYDETGNELGLHGLEDVRAFVREILGMPPGEDMARLFETVVGIPQGTFTAPFLEIPSVRKAIFERILRVEDYRRAADALSRFGREFLRDKEAVAAGRLEGLAAQTQLLAPRTEELRAAEQALVRLDSDITGAEAAAQAAQAAHALWQEKRSAFHEAQQRLALAETRVAAQRNQLSTAENALEEARQAGALAQQSLPAHEAYVGAQEALRALEARRQARADLELRQLALQGIAARLDKGLEEWREKLELLLSCDAALCALPLVQQDVAALDEAERGRIQASESLAMARKDLGETKRVQTALGAGRCPYHDMECLQQTRVLQRSGEEMAALEARITTARAEVEAAERRVSSLQESRGRLQVLARTRQERETLLNELNKFPAAVRRCLMEAAQPLRSEAVPEQWSASAQTVDDAQTALLALRAGQNALLEQMGAFAFLDGELEKAHAQSRENEARHLTYLKQSALAETAAGRQSELEARQTALERELKNLGEAQEAKARTEADFDAGRAEAAEQEAGQKREALAAARAMREAQARESSRLQREVAELLALQARQREAEQALEDIRNQQAYVKDASDVLKEMGEHMARRYRESLGMQAQGWYGQISGEAAVLRWTGDYDILLSDTHEGKARTRSFKQLSGGEQMTAALAVRMALLQTFSVDAFACFDEPTAGLDVYRREHLAAALAQVTGAFDQALIVSHDDTFDALSENVLLLQRGASGTTSVVDG